MKYDDASWHYGGDFPDGSPMEYGGTHIALFMKWCFIKGWAGKELLLKEKSDVDNVISNEMLATEFLFKHCDGKLTAESLNSEGNEFARSYYIDNDLYLADYVNLFAEEIYISSEREYDFDKLSKIIEERYITFKEFDSFSGNVLGQLAEQNDRKSSWWKFWS